MLKAVWMDKVRRGDVLWIGVLIVLAVGGLSLTFRTPYVCTAVMAGVLGLALWRWHEPLDFMLALAGIGIGPTMEFFATSTGLWSYPYPSVGSLPFWVFALWPVFPVCLVRLTHALLPPTGRRPRFTTELLLGVGIVTLEIPLLCGAGTPQPWLATLGTLVMLAPAFWIMRSKQTAVMLFISGVIGPLCESIPVQLGAWGYPSPAVLGLPLWLPTGYALFGFALVRVAMALELLATGAALGERALWSRS